MPHDPREPVMYLIVNRSLGMSPGKVGAQCAHAAAILALRAVVAGHLRPMEDARGCAIQGPGAPADGSGPDAAHWGAWLAASFKKIVLGADAATCLLLADTPGAVTVRDAGHTEVPAGSLTVVGLPPRPRDHAPVVIRGLRTL